MKELTIGSVLESVNAALEDVVIAENQVETDFAFLKIDSLKFISVIVALEEEFELEFPDSALLPGELNNVKKLFEVMRSVREGASGQAVAEAV